MKRLCLILLFATLTIAPYSDHAAESERFTPSIANMVKHFKGRGALTDGSPPPTPAESLVQFNVLDGHKLDVALHEPIVAQPLNMNFDERGRLWVVQYLQYPFPAGLKVLKYDKYLRAVFDKVPPPPPNHFRGKDKITIHEDTDGDGVFDKHKTFLDGLNITRSVVVGRGGVWVLMPPYLLFYPDRNRDDIPDSAPRVVLEGFGLEDTHSGANSLHWGPDGWLYGAHGSTCTANIRGKKFLGQAIWRYHPETDRFEVFAEGGGNTFSLEFDKKGRTFSGTNHGKTRGVHYAQGGAYTKNWGKHGPLVNPYSFGFFEHMKHQGYEPRFAQSMIIYEGGAIPKFEGSIVAGMALTSRVQASRFSRDTSSFQTMDTDILALSSNRWFRPVDTKAGPDGAIYIADWCDSRLSHLDPRDTWSKETGRIYRLRANGGKPQAPFDYATLTSSQLLQLFNHPNKWHRQMAIRILHDRKDASLLPELTKLVFGNNPQVALEAFWAVNASGGFDDAFALKTLLHSDEMIRYWTIRLIGDAESMSPAVQQGMAKLALREKVSEVRSQIASTMKRVPGEASLPILRELLRNEKDVGDIHTPLLLWWALENKATTHTPEILRMFEDSTFWETPIVKKFIVSRLGQRYTADRRAGNLATAAKLFDLAPTDTATTELIKGMEAGLQGNSVDTVPEALSKHVARLWRERKHDSTLISFAIRLNYPPALTTALEQVRNPKTRASEQSALIRLLAEKRVKEAAPVLMDLLKSEKSAKRQGELISALQRFTTTRIASLFIDEMPVWPASSKAAAVNALSGRLEWAQLMLDSVDQGTVNKEWISIGNLMTIQKFNCNHCDTLVRKYWGRLRLSNEEKNEEIKRVRDTLASGKGDAKAGRELFNLMCATCHRLGKDGKSIGPDLTGYERDNLDFIVPAIVDPSLAIREEFTAFNLSTKDGQNLAGFLVNDSPQAVTMMDLTGNQQVIPRREIRDLAASQTSLMPEGLLSALNEKQMRDLFAWFTTAPAK